MVGLVQILVRAVISYIEEKRLYPSPGSTLYAFFRRRAIFAKKRL
jgi:hypothetical protein